MMVIYPCLWYYPPIKISSRNHSNNDRYHISAHRNRNAHQGTRSCTRSYSIRNLGRRFHHNRWRLVHCLFLCTQSIWNKMCSLVFLCFHHLVLSVGCVCQFHSLWVSNFFLRTDGVFSLTSILFFGEGETDYKWRGEKYIPSNFWIHEWWMIVRNRYIYALHI